MYAKITKDLINCEEILGVEYVRENKVIFGTLEDATCGEPFMLRVRLLDDDRIPYYEADVDEDAALEPLFFWCQRDAGCTILQVWYTDRGWEDVIG